MKDVDIENKTIADVGCGWGRGVDTIAKYLNADITELNIAHNKTLYKTKRPRINQGLFEINTQIISLMITSST